MSFKTLIKKALIRTMLCAYLGRVDIDYLRAVVEKARRETINQLASRAAIYRNIKTDHGGELSVNELNLVTDLVIVLTDIERSDHE